MKSKWKVTSQYVGGEKIYQVYRLYYQTVNTLPYLFYTLLFLLPIYLYLANVQVWTNSWS